MSENKYNNSKIYLIKCRLDNILIYVGSTVQTLKQRWNEHKTRYKIESDKEYNKLLYIKDSIKSSFNFMNVESEK